jgi:hypothetical protein
MSSMLDKKSLDRIDDLVRWLPDNEYVPRSAVASGYTMSDLYRGNLLAEEQMAKLDEVAQLVGKQGRFVENEELLDAWLEAFELLSSVRPDEIGTQPNPPRP